MAISTAVWVINLGFQLEGKLTFSTALLIPINMI